MRRGRESFVVYCSVSFFFENFAGRKKKKKNHVATEKKNPLHAHSPSRGGKEMTICIVWRFFTTSSALSFLSFA